MRVKEMHPLCCISLESPGIGDQSPEMTLSRTGSGLPATIVPGGSDGNAGSEASFAGVLYKWTNYGKGWRSRWFLLRNGVLSYSKILMPETLALFPAGDDVRMIGDIRFGRLSRFDSSGGRRKNHKTFGIVHLKVNNFSCLLFVCGETFHCWQMCGLNKFTPIVTYGSFRKFSILSATK
ncbi:Oxysterol-binding protein-related protein 2A, partial [Sarracenia purpurea var. burkii]